MAERFGALGLGDLGAALGLRGTLLGEDAPEVAQIDVLELDAVDLDAPGIGGFVEHDAQLGVDLVAADQQLVELVLAARVAQGRLHQLLQGSDVVFHLVHGLARIVDAVVDDRVDEHRRVVARDDALLGVVVHLGTGGDRLDAAARHDTRTAHFVLADLADGEAADPFAEAEERQQHGDAGLRHAGELAAPLDDADLALTDDDDLEQAEGEKLDQRRHGVASSTMGYPSYERRQRSVAYIPFSSNVSVKRSRAT